jgi:uncharacterized protein (DUF433 family)
VDLVLGKLAGGMTFDEVMAEYELAKEDILSVLDYGRKAAIGKDPRRAIKWTTKRLSAWKCMPTF